MKILIYEPTSIDLNHVIFNQAILQAFDLIESNFYIFFSEQKHQENIKLNSNLKNIEFRKVKVIELQKKIRTIVNELINILIIRNYIKKNKVDQLFITNSHAHTLFFVKTLITKLPIHFIIHGQLEQLARNSKFKNFRFDLKFFLSYKNCHRTKYYVLGKSIKNNLILILPRISNNVFYFNHPIPLTHGLVTTNKKISNELHIATIGNHNLVTGSASIASLSNFLRLKKITSIKQHHIGKIDENIKELKNIKTYSHEINKMIARSVYEEALSQIDYVVFFHLRDSYKFTASGAIFDCILFEKPIIAIKNDYFEYLFEIIGPFGYLFENSIEMFSKIEILKKNNQDYQIFKNNIKLHKELFSVDNLSKFLNGCLNIC